MPIKCSTNQSHQQSIASCSGNLTTIQPNAITRHITHHDKMILNKAGSLSKSNQMSASSSYPSINRGFSIPLLYNSATTRQISSLVVWVSVSQKYFQQLSPSAQFEVTISFRPSNRYTRVTSYNLREMLTDIFQTQSAIFCCPLWINAARSFFSAKSIKSFCSLISTCTVLFRWSFMLSWVYSSSFLTNLMQCCPSALFLNCSTSSYLCVFGDLSSPMISLAILFSKTKQVRIALLQVCAICPVSCFFIFQTISLRASLSKKQRISLWPNTQHFTFSMAFLCYSLVLFSFQASNFLIYQFQFSGGTTKGRKMGVDISSILTGRWGSSNQTEGSTFLFRYCSNISQLSKQSQSYLQLMRFLRSFEHIFTTISKRFCSWREQVEYSFGLAMFEALRAATNSF